MTVRAVHAKGGGKHSHRIHKFVDRNSLENRNILKYGFRHLRSFLSSLAACKANSEQGRYDCSQTTQNNSPRSELHVFSLRRVMQSPMQGESPEYTPGL